MTSKKLAIVQSHGMMNIFDNMDISEVTKQDYLARLPRFIAFTQKHGIDRDLLLHYKQALRNDVTLGVSAKNKLLTTARITLRELYRQGKLVIDLSVGVKSFQQSNKHKVVGLNTEEVEKICQHLQSLDGSFRSTRLRAIVALLLFQGLRSVEVCRLDVKDIDLASNRIYIVGKGHIDSEPILLHSETLKALTALLKQSQVKHGPLLTHINRQSSGRRLTTRGLRQIFQSLLQEVGVQKATHGTRHFYSTSLIKHFRSDLTTVAKFTRHRNLEMLQVYNDEILDDARHKELAVVFDYSL